jgi:hypothetical protein
MFLAVGAAAREPKSVSYLDCGQKSNNVHSEEARIADRTNGLLDLEVLRIGGVVHSQN